MKQEPITSPIPKYAHQIWLAGVGAFRTLETEGNRLFERLVKESEAGKVGTAGATGARAHAKKSQIAKGEANRSQLAEYQKRLGQILEDSASCVLQWLHIVTKDDIQAVSHRIDALEASIRKWERVNNLRPAVSAPSKGRLALKQH